MTQQEFTNRTSVKVNEDEYRAIEVVYLASDLEKDDFCRMWCKMNAKRVATAKRMQKIEAEKQEKKDRIFDLLNRLDLNFFRMVEDVLGKRDLKFINSLGIDTVFSTEGDIRMKLTNELYLIR